jgi:peptidoglycan/LPS O-acetylase OafA/YrhL
MNTSAATTVSRSQDRPAPASRWLNRKFLPEVQALRAVAVLLVIVYHLRPSLAPGGFIGVDVFFVISGYLISGHMLREVGRTGRLNLIAFWAGRARRILPASLAVVLVTLAAAYLLLSHIEWERLASQALASVFYVQNWVLAAESVDYLAAETPSTALQHFWSLAVEEQFYLLWPLVVLAAAAASRRGRGVLRRHLPLTLAMFSAITIGSFAFSVAEVGQGDVSAYFSTLTRLWELGVGGILAVIVRYTHRFAAARSLLALFGWALIAAGVFTLDGASPFPGVNALYPVLGTAAVIAAGRTRGSLSLTRIVEWRPVQWIGDISYSLYLWHFPIITFFLAEAQRLPRLRELPVLFALTTLLAVISYYALERPLRSNRWLTLHHGRTLLVALLSMLLVAAATQPLAAAARSESDRFDALEQQILDGGVLGAAAMTSEADRYFESDIPVVVPNPAEAAEDTPPPECLAKQKSPTTKPCHFGDPGGSITVALVGDSQAGAMSGALDRLGREKGWRVVLYSHASCPFSSEKRQLELRGGTRCAEANASTLDALAELRPAAVFTTSFNAPDFVDSGTGHLPGAAGFADMWHKLLDSGTEVIAIRAAPDLGKERPVLSCVAENLEDLSRCDRAREDVLAADPIEAAAGILPQVTFIDLTSRFCGKDDCPLVAGNTLIFRDSVHVTDTFARTLAPYIEAKLPASLQASG